MHYADDTFALYESLFKEANAALTKEGRVGAVRRWLGRLVNPEAEKTIQQLGERVGQQDIAVDEIAEQLAKARFDEATRLRDIERLSKEVKTLGAEPGALSEAQQAASQAQQAAAGARRGRNMALGGGALALGAGLPAAYMVGQGQGEANKRRTRNIAFGAGAAAGLAAPTMIRGLGRIARGAGQTGIFPELEGAGGYY